MLACTIAGGGAGVGGAYLYNQLSGSGNTTTIYEEDRPKGDGLVLGGALDDVVVGGDVAVLAEDKAGAGSGGGAGTAPSWWWARASTPSAIPWAS